MTYVLLVLLGSVPVLILWGVLRWAFSLTSERAYIIAEYTIGALVLGECFLAWFLHQRGELLRAIVPVHRLLGLSQMPRCMHQALEEPLTPLRKRPA